MVKARALEDELKFRGKVRANLKTVTTACVHVGGLLPQGKVKSYKIRMKE